MFLTVCALLLVFGLLFVFKIFKKSKRNGLPPGWHCKLALLVTRIRKVYAMLKILAGPAPIPFLGNAHQLYSNPCRKFDRWAKEYGPAVTIHLGKECWVIINSPQLLKEIFGDLSSAGRTDNPIFHELMRGPHGIVFSDGTTWKQQRNFAVKTLKSFGTTSSSMESLLIEEAETLVKWLKQQGSKPIKPVKIFFAPAVNSLWTIICGKRCEWELGQSGKKVVDEFFELFHSISICIMNGILFAPTLIKIAPRILGWKDFQKKVSTIRNSLENVIAEHVKSFDTTQISDYINAYIANIQSTMDSNSSFYKNDGHFNLVANLIDLFGAGSETTTLAMSWASLYLSKDLKIQTKIYEEITSIIGDGTPCTQYKSRMPYTEATILETLRIRPVFYISLPHRMLEDHEFKDYMLKKGTVVIANLFTMLHDEASWKDPEVFNPERFLKNGKVDTKIASFVAFSDGKRKCIGEAIARNSMFIFLTHIVKHFEILPVGNPSTEPNVRGFLEPKEFEVILRPRITLEK